MAEKKQTKTILKCTECGEEVDPQGKFAHFKENHRDIGEWDDLKEDLYEEAEIEVEEEPPRGGKLVPPEEEARKEIIDLLKEDYRLCMESRTTEGRP